MKKAMAILLALTFLLVFWGCKKAQPCRVYSFSGENDRFAVVNGVIVLHEDWNIFYGGDLVVTGDDFAGIVSYSTTFYVLTDNGQNIVLSNGVADMTGGTLPAPGDLGQIAGADVVLRGGVDERDLQANLYFALTTTDADGEESVYQLQMQLTEVTQ